MHIVDNEGQVVMTLRSKSFSAHNKWYVFAGNSTDKEDKIATVKPHESSISAEVGPMLPAAFTVNIVSHHLINNTPTL